MQLIKTPCPYCGALDDCACREFMALLADMTPEEKQKLDQFMTELRENGGNPQ